MIKQNVDDEMNFLQEVVTAIRNIRGELNIAPSKPISVYLKTDANLSASINYFKKLTRAEEVFIGKDISKPDKSTAAVVKNCEI